MNEGRLDGWISEICGHQYGVISLEQLLLCGLSAEAVRQRIRRGRLHRVHRGVYSLAPTRLLSHAGRAYAAVLAAGDAALLSHGSAAWWWALTQRRRRRRHVSRPGTATRARAGIVIHGRTGLGPEDRAVHERMALTSVERTLFDQAPTAERDDLANQIDHAVERHIYDHAAMEALMHRYPGAPGAPLLRGIFRTWQPPAFTRSDGEKILRRLIHEGGLPKPRVNMELHGYERDFVWPDRGLVVEYDGWDGHKTRTQQERDRRRDASLAAVGVLPLRITGLQLTHARDWVLETIGQALAAR